jgi:hypothetical protein
VVAHDGRPGDLIRADKVLVRVEDPVADVYHKVMQPKRLYFARVRAYQLIENPLIAMGGDAALCKRSCSGDDPGTCQYDR